MRLAALLLLIASTSLADAKAALSRRLLAIDTPATRASLVEVGGAGTEATLLELAKEGSTSTLSRAAIAALGHFPSEATRAFLVELRTSDDEGLRKVAIETLSFGFKGNPHVERAFLDALDDAAPAVRRAAIRALDGRKAHVRRALEAVLAKGPDTETQWLLERALAR